MRWSGVACGGVLAATMAVAQEPSPAPDSASQPPVFAVGVDLVAVDVSVIDTDGRPLLGLQPVDFEIEVDGRTRVVASTEYVGRDLESASPPAARPAHYSSNEDASPGRLVLLLVDRGNIGRGAGRLAMDAAQRFLGSLAPSDRVGLAVVPGPGPQIEFTADYAQVRQALKHIVGQGERAGFQVPLTEALAFVVRNDRLRWQEFVELECRYTRQVEQCIQQMEAEAQQVVMNYRERSQQSKRALETVFLSLRSVPGPKTVVLISEGLATESPGETRRLAEVAAEAQVTLFVLLFDSSGVDAQFRKEQLATPDERELETRSLYDLAGMARGAVLPVIGSADAPFQRLARELTGYYLVGFEPEAADRDGKTHTIRVRVKHAHAAIRSRGLVSIPSRPPSPQQVITTALRSPLVERGLTLRVATFARPAPQGKVRLLLAAEMLRASRPVSVGFALIAPAGKVAASRLVEGLSAGDGEAVVFAGEATLDPGVYSLRLAAVDAAGRRGSVQREAKVAVVTAGDLMISDLVLALPGAGGLRPAVDLEAGAAGLQALVELAGRDASALGGADVALELAETAASPALLRVPAETGGVESDGVRVARVKVAGGLLPPGEYVARAAVSVDGKPVATVTRPFRVAALPVGVQRSAAPLAALLAAPPRYDRGELLGRELVSHALDKVLERAAGPLPEPVAAAVAEARGGRVEAMLAKLPQSGADARVFFLRGLSYYAAGNLNAAMTQFQAALRSRSDFFLAAVYMGGCYAAAGKDLEAIGAWQTALIGESGSGALYGVLADALLRVREAEQAVAILDEGLVALPQEAALRRRLGLAHAMAGHTDEALGLLGGWVDAHPDDSQALLATLALLFDAFSREAAGGVQAEQRQLLRRYSRAYLDGNGPHREIVERWVRYLDSRPLG